MATTIPGGVTSNVVGSTYNPGSIQDQATAYNLLEKMKADKQREWDVAAQKNARLGQAVDLIYKPSSGIRPQPTPGQYNLRPEKFPTMPGMQSPVRWLDPASKTVGWDVERATKDAIKKGEQIPIFLQGYNPSPQM